MNELIILDESNTEVNVDINSPFFYIQVIEENITSGITLNTVWDGATVELYDKYNLNDSFQHIQINEENVVFGESLIKKMNSNGGEKPVQLQLKLIGGTANTKILIRFKQ